MACPFKQEFFPMSLDIVCGNYFSKNADKKQVAYISAACKPREGSRKKARNYCYKEYKSGTGEQCVNKI